jgi:outer membrane biosynthesis protein TonB
MAAAAASILVFSEPTRGPRVAGLGLSVLLHLILAAAFMVSPLKLFPPPTPEMIIEVVTLPEPAPPPQPLRAEPPRPEPAPPAVARPLPPPPVPQLEEAPIAERSSPPPVPVVEPPRPRPAPPAPTMARPQPAPAPPRPAIPPVTSARPEATPVSPGGALESAGVNVQQRETGAPAVASQSVQDFILAQIARFWIIDFQGPRFRDLELTTQFVLLPNGMLAPPFGKNDPWDLTVMAPNHARWEPRVQQAALTFLQAMRQAQPFHMPPDGRSDQPRVLPLHFLLGEMRARR